MRFSLRRTIILILLATLGYLILTYVSLPAADDRIPGLNVSRKNFAQSQKYTISNSAANVRDLGELIDWHNYTFIKLDLARNGRGERERVVLSAHEKSEDKKTFHQFGYSQYVSDLISLDRSIDDIRHPLCKEKRYHANLAGTSVVMPFHNEAPSVLLRSVHSILNKSPESLLVEIILVDDASTLDQLKPGSKFEQELLKLPKAKMVRSQERVGLITARTLGAKDAIGEVLTFLDSHVECSYNWLPPLLDRIARNYRSVPQPMIDVVAREDFHYEEQPGGVLRGSFSWELLYKRLPITALEKRDTEDAASPIRTPVQAGGLFSIHRDWFWEMGGYDPFLKIWGGEQYEISFKTWMCGGEMEEVPCSRVGHIYRGRMTFSVPGGGNVIGNNHARVAELWMDEYKEFYYRRRGRPELKLLGSDLEERRRIRERLKCHSFKWYMDTVAYDQEWYYPSVEPQPYASGKCRSVAYPDRCFSIVDSSSVLLPCGQPSVLTYMLTWRKEMKVSSRCVDLFTHAPGDKPTLFECHAQGGNQMWKYSKDSSQVMLQGDKSANVCLGTDGETVFMKSCDANDQYQKWQFDFVDFSRYRPELGPPYDRSLGPAETD